MRLRRLQWLVSLGPPLFVLLVILGSWLPHTAGVLGDQALLLTIALLLGVIPFSIFMAFVFRALVRLQQRLVIQNEELGELNAAIRKQADQLRGLNEASLALASEPSLEAVLQKIVDRSRELVGARYGVLAVLDKGGLTERLLTAGLRPAEGASSNSPIARMSEVEALLRAGRPPSSSAAPASADPEGLPPRESFLDVPIRWKGNTIGQLYLADKEEGEFGQEDRELTAMFAAQAAVAIENARLYRQIEREAIVEERERISRELHDNLAQVLGYVSVKAQAALEMLAIDKRESATSQIEQLATAARELYGDLREQILGLRAAQDLHLGLQSALDEYARQLSQDGGIGTKVMIQGSFPPFLSGTTAEAQLLRIIQEALSNVRKHSTARQAWIRFEPMADNLRVTIEDDGQGFDPSERQRQKRPQFGLLTMHERAESIGASFQVQSELGRGTRVMVVLPHNRAEQGIGYDEGTNSR